MKKFSSDRQLVKNVLHGKRGAFDQLFENNFARLFRFAMRRVDGNEDLAREIAQQTLCTAMTQLHTYRGEAALFTWLCQICRNQLSAWFRKEAVRTQRISLIEDHPDVRAVLESLEASELGPENNAFLAEVGDLVRVTLDHLPANYGNALEWKYVEGYSTHEIAKRLGLSAQATDSLLARARRAFKQAMGASTPHLKDLFAS